MAKRVHTTEAEGPLRDDLVLLRHDDQITLVDEPVDRKQVRERHVARLRLLWYQRTFLLRFSLIGLFFSLLIAFLIPSRYASTARLMPPDSGSSTSLASVAAALSSANGIGSLSSSLLGIKNTSDIFVGVLGSRTAQDKLVEQFDLKKIYGAPRIEDARQELANRTSISVDRKSQIITIQVTDTNARMASALCAAYVEELNYLVSSLSTSSARRERVFLEGRLSEVRGDLETAEKKFSQFASKNTAIDITEQGKAMVGAAASLQGELIAAQSELEGLKQIYSDNNVRVRSLVARVDELQSQLQKLVGKDSSDPTHSEGSTYPSIRMLPLLGVSYADLFRQTKIQEAVFETLTKEYELAKVQEAKEIPTVEVLDHADVPEKKSFPPRMLIGFLGTLLCCALGVLFILGSATWNAVDAQDPGKIFARQVFAEAGGRWANGSQNGSRSMHLAQRIQAGIGWRQGSDRL